MNYIHQLRYDNARLKQRIEYLEEALNQFNTFLHSEKFTGTQQDGSRKDWIATADVVNWIREVRRASADIFPLQEPSQRFQPMSPDGLPISLGTFSSADDAESAVHVWAGRYSLQGYYSTAGGERITLDDLPLRCTIEPIEA